MEKLSKQEALELEAGVNPCSDLGRGITTGASVAAGAVEWAVASSALAPSLFPVAAGIAVTAYAYCAY